MANIKRKESALYRLFWCMFFVCLTETPMTRAGQECNLTRFESVSCRQYSTRHGLPNANIEYIAQDDDGFIWACTQQGMARYDGYAFQVFDAFPESWSKYVLTCLFDKKGILWVGTLEGIAYFLDDHFVPVNLDLKMSRLEVRDLVETPDGDKWFFCQNQGPFCIHNGKLVTSYALPEKTGILDIDIGPDGRVWVGTLYGLYRFDEDAFRQVTLKDIPANATIDAVNITGEFEGWLAVRPGKLVHFDEKGVEIHPISSGENQKSINVWDMVSRENQVWLATNRGLFFWNRHRMEHFTVNTGLNSNQIYCLLSDREGLIWYGSDNGLGRVKDIRFRCLKPSRTLPVSSVFDLFRDSSGAIWIGTAEGLIECVGDRIRLWTGSDGLSDDTVVSVFVRNNGDVLIGNMYGLDRMRNGRIHVLDKEKTGGVFDITEDSDGSIWLSGGYGLFKLEDDRLTSENMAAGLPSNAMITTVFFDSKGFMWVLTEGAGVFRGRKEAFPLKHIEQLPSDRVFSIDESEKGEIWLATVKGACQMNGDTPRLVFNENQGLASENIWTVRVDCHNDIWMATSKGISLLKEGRIYNYNVDDGISGDDLMANCAVTDADGRIWFGGTGITIIDPNMKVVRQRPKIFLTYAAVNGKPLYPNERIPHGSNTVEFWFSCLSFANENRNMYRYQLVGFDEFRSEPTSSPYIRYTNLPTGRYRLVAEGMNRDGLWSEKPVEIEFEILPAWWEYRWVQILEVIFFILVVVLFARIRNARVRKRADELKREVDRQTQVIKDQVKKLEEQRNLLARLAVTDDLTGVYNRRYFFTALTKEWKRQNRYHHPLSLVLFDIDHFKEINDTYGHAVGDEVLVYVTQKMQKMIRSSDILARFGGEEFILLLPETGLETARRVAERIRMAIADSPYRKEAYDAVTIHVSGGISSTEGPHAALNPDSLIRQADLALYKAKRSGRNRIEVYTGYANKQENDE